MWQRRRRGAKTKVVPPKIGHWPSKGSGPQAALPDLTDVHTIHGSAGAGVRLLRLSELQAGDEAVLHSFDAGHGLVSRLSALGFTPGARLTMLQNIGDGPLIVKVRDTLIALGRGEAMKILVRRWDGQ